MGRRKLKIQRLLCVKARRAKYVKRKIGLLKKAKELATLCDIDLVLLMFSPIGKPSLYVGQDKDLSIVVEKLSTLSIQDREERRAYTMKIIEKMSRMDDSETLPNNFAIGRGEAYKLQQAKLQDLKEKLAQKRKVLRDWENPNKINDIAQIKIMEEHVVATLRRIMSKKIELLEEQRRCEVSQVAMDSQAQEATQLA